MLEGGVFCGCGSAIATRGVGQNAVIHIMVGRRVILVVVGLIEHKKFN